MIRFIHLITQVAAKKFFNMETFNEEQRIHQKLLPQSGKYKYLCLAMGYNVESLIIFFSLCDSNLGFRPLFKLNYKKIENESILLYNLAGAIAELHEINILNNDIKTDNFLAKPDGVVKLIDFGFSTHISGK